MLIYAAIGIFGFLFLLVMLFLGEIGGGDHEISAHDLSLEHGDADHGGPSVFSARIMASFLTAFGVGGVVARYYDLSVSNSWSGGDRKLDKVPTVGDPAHMVQIGG